MWFNSSTKLIRRLFAVAAILVAVIYFLAIGPYLPSPKHWFALYNKQQVSYKKPTELHTISIVIPSYNEGIEMLYNTIKSAISNSKHPNTLEIIVVDGGSKDNTMDATKYFTNIIRTSSQGGRGPAINKGIELATGSLILMLHSDCILQKNYDEILQYAFADKNVLISAFEFNSNSKIYPELTTVENRVHRRSNSLWMPYGDQALAIRKSDLELYFNGQIPNYKMMEDFEFVLRARELALANNKAIAILPQKVVSSPRRFLAKGHTRTALLNWFFVTSYVWGGISPNKIFSWYYST